MIRFELELSTDLRDRQDWEAGTLGILDRVLDANTFAFDLVSSILAVGELPPYFIASHRCYDIRLDWYYRWDKSNIRCSWR